MLSHLELYVPSIKGREWAAALIAAGNTLPPYRTLVRLIVARIAGAFGCLIALPLLQLRLLDAQISLAALLLPLQDP